MHNCIFHIPFALNENRPSASQIRPAKMQKAFESLGYNVDVIAGDVSARRKAISEVYMKLAAGERYDFVYSESSTMPTLLTEPDHVPRSPNLDFSFLSHCKRYGIPIGLFYRDMYWLYSEYRSIGLIKSVIGKLFYRYDLLRYNGLLDICYFPSKEAQERIKPYLQNPKMDVLPPGCDIDEEMLRQCAEASKAKEVQGNILRLFYVGGIGGHYGFHDLLSVVCKTPQVELRLCVRPDDWKSVESEYEQYLSEGNVHIIHASGDGLREHLQWADLGVLYFDRQDYRDMAIPYKTFEYLSCGLPSLSTVETAAGRFVMSNGVGIAVHRGDYELESALLNLSRNRKELTKLQDRCRAVAKKHTWEERASYVASTLKDT